MNHPKPTNKKTSATTFHTFKDATRFAALNVKGYPAWRVETLQGQFVIALIPEQLWMEIKR